MPLRFVVDSGPRGIVDALVDGNSVPMLVHANAGFTVMLTHDALRRVTGRTVEKESEFGLGHDLRVSPRGRGSTELGTLDVAGARLTNVPCAVFDLPTTNWEGMLGVGWLDAVRPVVDFGSRVLSLAQPAAGDDASTVSFALDETLGRYVVDLLVDDEPATFVVSTVAGTTLDLGFARSRGIQLAEPEDEEHGPTGAVVPVRRTLRPVSLAEPSGPIVETTPQVYDTYAYRGEERPPGNAGIAGYLGADALLDAAAILDFA